MKASIIGRGLACAAAAVLSAACGSEAPAPTGRSMSAPAEAASAAENEPPAVVEVMLDPSEPQAGATVTARVRASDPDGDAVELEYTWLVDGRRVGERGASLQVPDSLRKGAPIEVEVTARDGRTSSEPARAQGQVGNRGPALLGVRVEPFEGAKVGTELVAVADASDPDGDLLQLSHSWRVNGRPVPGDGERFSTSGLARGDRVQVRVSASDGRAETAPLDSAPVTIGNSAPVITSTPDGVSADGRFHYAVQVSDPDGDRRLRFQLAQAPEGAQIDPVLGEVSWTASREKVGSHTFEVVVQDGHGGEARQRFDVTVREIEKDVTAATGDDEDAPVAAIE